MYSTYVCMYVCMYVCVCVCVHLYIYTCSIHRVLVFLCIPNNLQLCVMSCTVSSPALPTETVSPVESTSDYPAVSDISLQCSWNTSVYYVAWYKNGVLIYEEDLAASSVLMGTPQGISVDSDFTMMMSSLTIASAALDDSGNYTCAVTCGAKGVEFGIIAGNLQDTADVFVYGE